MSAVCSRVARRDERRSPSSDSSSDTMMSPARRRWDWNNEAWDLMRAFLSFSRLRTRSHNCKKRKKNETHKNNKNENTRHPRGRTSTRRGTHACHAPAALVPCAHATAATSAARGANPSLQTPSPIACGTRPTPHHEGGEPCSTSAAPHGHLDPFRPSLSNSFPFGRTASGRPCSSWVGCIERKHHSWGASSCTGNTLICSAGACEKQNEKKTKGALQVSPHAQQQRADALRSTSARSTRATHLASHPLHINSRHSVRIAKVDARHHQCTEQVNPLPCGVVHGFERPADSWAQHAARRLHSGCADITAPRPMLVRGNAIARLTHNKQV